MGFNPFKEAEKAAKKAVDKIVEPAANKAKSLVYKAKDEVKKKVIDEVEDKAKSVIKDIDKHVIEKVEDVVTDEIPKAITKELPKLMEEGFEALLEELASAVTKEGLKTVRSVVRATHSEMDKLAKNKPDLVDSINALGGYVEIGPLTLSYSGFYTRISDVSDVLDTYINKPPEFRRGPILKMVEALGPTEVDAGISIQVVALVVGSKELGIGGGINGVPLKLFTELGDVILEKMGVPA